MGMTARRHGRAALLAVTTALLLPLALGGPGCGGGGGSDAEEACTVLPFPGSGTAMVADQQVLLQIRFLSASDAFVANLGFDFDLTAAEQTDPGVADTGTSGESQAFVVPSGAVGGGDPSRLLVPQGHGANSLLPVAHIATVDPFADVSVHPFLPGPGCVTFDPASRQQAANVERDFSVEGLAASTRTPAYTLHFERLDDAQVAALLQAVAQDVDGVVATSPTLSLYDRQRAVVMLRNRGQAVPDFDTPFADALLDLDPTTTAALTGPALDLVPRVSGDRTEITLDIRPTQVVTARPSSFFDVGPSAVASLAEVGIFRIRQIVSNVSIPDGGTVLLGGYRTSTDTTTRPGVPFLRDIPVVGGLTTPFVVRDDRELLVLVTAHVVD